MQRILLLRFAIITTIFVQSVPQALTKQIRVRYPSQLQTEGNESESLAKTAVGGGVASSRRNWRRIGKVQRNVSVNDDNDVVPNPDESVIAEPNRTELRDPIAESLKGSEFIPNNMDPYTSKLATRRRQTFMWRPKQVEDLFIFNYA